jgi:hypothetical protein
MPGNWGGAGIGSLKYAKTEPHIIPQNKARKQFIMIFAK